MEACTYSRKVLLSEPAKSVRWFGQKKQQKQSSVNLPAKVTSLLLQIGRNNGYTVYGIHFGTCGGLQSAEILLLQFLSVQ